MNVLFLWVTLAPGNARVLQQGVCFCLCHSSRRRLVLPFQLSWLLPDKVLPALGDSALDMLQPLQEAEGDTSEPGSLV